MPGGSDVIARHVCLLASEGCAGAMQALMLSVGVLASARWVLMRSARSARDTRWRCRGSKRHFALSRNGYGFWCCTFSCKIRLWSIPGHVMGGQPRAEFVAKTHSCFSCKDCCRASSLKISLKLEISLSSGRSLSLGFSGRQQVLALLILLLPLG